MALSGRARVADMILPRPSSTRPIEAALRRTRIAVIGPVSALGSQQGERGVVP
jgi:hypothetical protein